MRQRVFTLVLATLAATAVACSDDDKEVLAPVNTTVTFTASLSGANEVPANASTATGTFTATLDTATYAFTYDITFTGLSGTVNNGHIHGPAAAGVNSGTTINFNTLAGATFSFGLSAGTAHGSTTLNAGNQITATVNGDSLRKLMLAGLTYANIHTTAFPGGEIRGQITKQ
jgi:hypothetical protein